MSAPCYFQNKCVNFDCTFEHPTERRKKCNWGANCKKQKYGCPFLHPKREHPKREKKTNAVVGIPKQHQDNVVKLQFSYATADQKEKKITVEQVRKTLCYTAAVDTSGSMVGSRILAALEGLDVIVNKMMHPNDLFGLVTFNTECRNLHFPMQRSRVNWEKDKSNVQNNIGGRTALWDAITSGVLLAKSVFEKRKRDPNRFQLAKLVFEQLVITDGMDNSSKTSFEKVKALVNKPGLPDYHLLLIVVTSDMESSQVQRLAELTAPAHAKLIEVSDVQSLKRTLQHEADRLRLVVESTDRTGKSTAGFKGTLRSVKEINNSNFKAGLDGLVPKELISRLQTLTFSA